jgi:hypothetical protein
MDLEEALFDAAGIDDTTDSDADVIQTPPQDVPAADAQTPQTVDLPGEGDVPGDDTPSGAPEKGGPPETGLLEYVKQKTGQDFTSKYKDDATLVDGLVSATRRLSERDEAASNWKAFTENPEPYMERARQYWEPQIRQEVMREMAERQAPPGAPPSDLPASAGPPQSPHDFDPRWLPYLQLKEDAPQEVQSQLSQWAGQRQLANHMAPLQQKIEALEKQLASIPPPDHLTAGIHQQLSQELQQQQYRQQEQQFAENFYRDNASKMAIGGDYKNGLTPVGQEFQRLVMVAQEKGLRTAPDQVEYAKALLHSKWNETHAAPPVPGAQHATHVPGVGSAAPAKMPAGYMDDFGLEGSIIKNLKSLGIPIE